MNAITDRVLVAGEVEVPELHDLSAQGVEVERASSLVRALEILGRGGRECVVVVDARLVNGREESALGALREAGARTLVAVYPAAIAHRAPRADRAGADVTLTLPAHPDRFANLLRRIAERPAPAPHLDALASVEAPGRPARTMAETDGDEIRIAPAPDVETLRAQPANGISVEALIGDVAVINRSVDDLERLLDQVVASFIRRSGARRCSVMLRDSTGGRDELYVRKAAGLPDPEAWDPVPVGSGISGHVARTGNPLLVRDLKETDLPAAAGARSDYRTESFLVLPLRGSEGVGGVVCLSDKSSGEPFTEADQRVLLFLADHAAQAIENALKVRQLQDLSVIDELTGLFNRRQFQRSLEREVQRARRYQRHLTLALFDLDHFKKYNDVCGHQAGDRALSLVGELLRTSLREVDIVARYGGEEFAVILPETTARPEAGASNPFPFLERLRRQVEEAQFPGQEKLPGGSLTLSGGLACFPDDADSVDELIREADRALYVSKAHGRNRISYRGRPLNRPL